MEKKVLVAYFSASEGKVTERISKKLAAEVGADLYEIEPVTPYTEADIRWTNPLARCNKEKMKRGFRPPIKTKDIDMGEYDVIYLGFPIWYYSAPQIVYSFLESYDFSGKTIIVYATSGGSGIGKSAEKLKASAPSAKFISTDIVMNDVELEKLALMLK